MIDYILEKTPQDELLAQLAEEAAELGHAALKLRRAYTGASPTPVKLSDAVDAVVEEIADVHLLLGLLGFDGPCLQREYERIGQNKLRRWATRLREKEVESDGAS